jgi:hypothetical protein
MKRSFATWALTIAGCVSLVRADTTIDPAYPRAYGANVGWLHARTDLTNGAVIGQYYCSGYLYGANVGWIFLGDGSPGNGHAYANDAAEDCGVNHDGQGSLSGYAWGANIGWINFEPTGNPRVDLRTGNLCGHAWGANVGWIGLSNAQAHVRTETLDPGPDSDLDGLPDAWEYARAGGLRLLDGGAHDQDGDGVTDEEEYGADTDPLADTDFLRIVSFGVFGSTNSVAWTSRPTRLYRLEATNTLTGIVNWTDAGPGLLGPPVVSPVTQTVSGVTATTRFYRVRAVMPLSK